MALVILIAGVRATPATMKQAVVKLLLELVVGVVWMKKELEVFVSNFSCHFNIFVHGYKVHNNKICTSKVAFINNLHYL